MLTENNTIDLMEKLENEFKTTLTWLFEDESDEVIGFIEAEKESGLQFDIKQVYKNSYKIAHWNDNYFVNEFIISM